MYVSEDILPKFVAKIVPDVTFVVNPAIKNEKSMIIKTTNFKEMLSSILMKGAVKVNDLEKQLMRQYNLSDKQISDVVKRCKDGNEDF